MKWENEARQVVDAIPVHDIIKNMVILYAEKTARKNKHSIVDLQDVIETRDAYFEWFGQDKIAKIQKAREEGKTDEAIDPMIELNKGPALYTVELCHSRFFGCDRDLINVREVGKRVKEKMEQLHITEILADKACEPLMPHSTFTVSISGCANACTAPESRDVGVHGSAIPMVTDIECSQCGKCAHACLDQLIHYENGKPVINENFCVLCGNCIQVCPTGTLQAKKKGCRIMVGGYFGKWARYGDEIYKVTDVSNLFPVLEACVELVKKEWNEQHEDHFSRVVKRNGVEFINDYIRKKA
jgi:dissimilatory sulfite reductase (desulfoviridin) alpha/beta subunit